MPRKSGGGAMVGLMAGALIIAAAAIAYLAYAGAGPMERHVAAIPFPHIGDVQDNAASRKPG